MLKQKSMPPIIFLLSALILVLAFVCFRAGAAHAETGKDFVIVIDISTSMQDIFDDVKRLSKRTIAGATVGDNVAVITFGEQATLVERKQIRGNADLVSLQNRVDELYPTDYTTYINRGLEKGLSELRYLFDKNPDRERVLLWLSDDKDNPPKVLGNEFVTLEKLKENNTGFEPGNEWFQYDAPKLDDAAENRNIEDFVMWARRTTFRVTVKEQGIDLGSFEDGNVKKSITLTFEPRHPGAAGLEFFTSARLVNRNDPAQQIEAVTTPDRIRASGQTWKQNFQIAFKAPPGEYSGVISFRPIAGTALEIEPGAISFKTAIIPPKLEPPVEPVAEPKPEGLLADAKEKGIIATEDRPPGLTRIEKPIAFGPLEPGKKYSKIVTLFVDKEVDPKSITHDLSIELPPGVNLESKVFGTGTKLAAEIAVEVDKEIELPETFSLDGSREGSVRFKSSESGVEVLPLYIPIQLTFNQDKVRWGRKLLPKTVVGQAKARRMSFEELTEQIAKGREAGTEESASAASPVERFFAGPSLRYILLPLLAAVIAIIAVLLYRMRPASQTFIGELVPIKDPTDSNMKNLNLKRIGALHDKNALIIGNSAKADIRLSHDSVAAVHCRIAAKETENHTEISIHPIKGHPVRVNEIEQTEKVPLSDKDLIGIGDFILLFSNPEPQKEVVARFIDGRTMRGTPVTWDIGMSSFEMLRSESAEAEGTTEEIAIIDFKDIKAIFFLQEDSGTGPDVAAEMINKGEIIEVTFSDGEKIEGYPFKDYSDSAGRFYLVPREMPNVASILIERASVEKLEKHKASAEPEKAKSAGLLGSARKRKGAAEAE